MTLKHTPIPLLAGVLFAFPALHGSALVTYTEFHDEFEELVTTPTTLASGLTAGDIALSGNGTLSTGSVNAGDWSSPLPYLQGNSGWDETDPGEAKAFTFTLEAETGLAFSLAEFRFEDRATSAGPSAMGVWINDTPVFSRDVADGENEVNLIDLTGLGFEGLTSAAFTIAGWDNGSRSTTGGGQWRTAGYEVGGSVSPIPEPSTWTLLGGLAAFAAVTLKKRLRRE